jgi:hypothetical protein
VPFLLSDESPNFVTLNIFHRNVADDPRQHFFAATADLNQELHDRVAVEIGYTLSSPNTVTLNQEFQGKHCLLSVHGHGFQGLLLGLCEGFIALATLIPLIPLRSFPNRLASLRQFWQVIGESPLEIRRRMPHTEIASLCGFGCADSGPGCR